MKRPPYWLLAAITAAVLTACGGGSDDDRYSSVKVAGDSLADSGSFGYKFTVQGSSASAIWPELVAQDYQTSLCPHYQANSAGGFNVQASCGNYAVGGARINHPSAPQSPLSVLTQLQSMGAAGYGRDELVLVYRQKLLALGVLLEPRTKPVRKHARHDFKRFAEFAPRQRRAGTVQAAGSQPGQRLRPGAP